MTALAGVWRMDSRPDADRACARMLAAQSIFGTNDSSFWSDREVAVGSRLTPLLPEDRFDRQPLIGGGGRYVLVADIRLDNRDELAEQLDLADIAGLSDADVLLAAIERWNEHCVERIFGDFAFACWDAKLRRFFLARDQLGQQPLHYHRAGRLFAFSSMPKGLHALPDIPYAPDEERIAEKLLLMPEDGTRSFFKAIDRVPPGHFVIADTNSLRLVQYWNPPGKPIRYRSPDDYAERARELLDQAVRCRLRGADKLGVFLSGGFDSGAVAATAARILAPSGRRFFAFTGVPRRGYAGPTPKNSIDDEGPYAIATASLYPNIDHVIVHNEGCHSPAKVLDENFYIYDRPSNGFTDAGMAQSFQKAIVARGVRVTLAGGAGNQGLSYDGMGLLPELFCSGGWLHLLNEARALVRTGQMGWRGVVRDTLGPWCPPPLWLRLHRLVGRWIEDPAIYSAISPQRHSELEQERLRTHDFVYRPFKNSVAARIWELRRNDRGNFRKGTLAAYKTDNRDPMADVRLLDFCLAIPTDQFLKNGVTRALARRALADRLPKVVLDERRNARQVSDWHEDLTTGRGGLAAELDRIEQCAPAAAAIDVPRLRRLLDNWPSDSWDRPEVVMAYRLALPRAIAIGHFVRRAARSNA